MILDDVITAILTGVKVKVRQRSRWYFVGFEERGHRLRDAGSFWRPELSMELVLEPLQRTGPAQICEMMN